MRSDRIHWSNNPHLDVKLEHKIYKQEHYFKPEGFWYELNGEWIEWCKSEDFHPKDYIHPYRVVLKPDIKILMLKSTWHILDFTDKYAVQSLGQIDRFRINWEKVASRYDAIEIAPYQWQLRTNARCLWYYPWDVASGCVWNLDKIFIEKVIEKQGENICNRQLQPNIKNVLNS